MDKRMSHNGYKWFLSVLIVLMPVLPLRAQLKAGQKLTYDVVFGNMLKGHAVIKFYGKVASATEVETVTVYADSSLIGDELDVLPESTLIIEADSLVKYCPVDSGSKPECDSLAEGAPVPITTVKKKVHDILYITYDTQFIGNIYNLHADIYTTKNFFPLLIETRIARTGNTSHGKELFFPEKRMAIFSQTIGDVQEIDTLVRENPLQDVTTLPFYFSGLNNAVGSTFDVSLSQGEYTLTYVDTERIEYGEGYDYHYYDTYRIESQPKDFTLWINMKNKIPVKVHIESQKLLMILANREIDKTGNGSPLPENRIKQKLAHIFGEK